MSSASASPILSEIPRPSFCPRRRRRQRPWLRLPIATAQALPAPGPTPQAEADPGIEFVVKVADKDLLLGRELAGKGNPGDAINAYSRAIQRSPDDAVPWRELADLISSSESAISPALLRGSFQAQT